MKTMQVYWVEPRPHLLEKAKPGQFVHSGNGGDLVCGFLAEIDRVNERVLIVLFEPREAAPYADVVHEQVSDSFWTHRLRDVMRADPEIAADWSIVLGNSCSNN